MSGKMFQRRRRQSAFRRQRIALIAAIFAVFALIGYQFIPDDSTASAATSITTLDGNTLEVPQSGRATAVYFFSTACPTCLPVLGRLATISSKYPDVSYLPVSINPSDNANTVGVFLRSAGDANRSAAVDDRARLAQALSAPAVGTLIVFDRGGSAVYRGIDPDSGTLASAFAKATK